MVDEAPRRNRRRAGTDFAEFGKAQVAGSVAREAPGAGDRISTESRRIAQLSDHSAEIEARLRRRKPRRIAESAANEVRIRLLGRSRLVGDGIVAHDRQAAVAGIHEAEHTGRIGAARNTGVAVEIPVGPHEEIVATADTTDLRLDPAPHGIDRDERLALCDEERDVRERERRHVRGEIREIEERHGRRGKNRHTAASLGRSRCVSREADMILDHAGHRIDRLEADERVGGSAVERCGQGRRQPAVAGNSHIEPQLLGRIGRYGLGAGLDAARPGRIAGWHLHGADEGVAGAERAAREIVGVGSLSGAGLVGVDVRVATNVKQPPARIEDRECEIAADAVAIVEVEDRRPGLQAAVHAADRLDLLVVERKGVPVDVARVGDIARDADRVAIGLEQVPHVLGRRERVIRAACILRSLADERRVAGQALDVDADRGIADVGVADRRPRLLVELTQPHPQFVGPAGRTALHLRRVGEVGFVCRLGLRRHAAVRGDGRHRLVPRLAPHANEILDRRADGLAVARQHHPHARIFRVRRVVIPGTHRVAGKRLRQALGSGSERRSRVRVDKSDFGISDWLAVVGERQDARRRIERARRGQEGRNRESSNRRDDDVAGRVDRDPLVCGKAQEAVPPDAGSQQEVVGAGGRLDAGDIRAPNPPLEL